MTVLGLKFGALEIDAGGATQVQLISRLWRRLTQVFGGSGGCRKLRRHTAGKGKRGGVRVIYYLKLRDGCIWLLTIYGKNVQENIPAHALKTLKEAILHGE